MRRHQAGRIAPEDAGDAAKAERLDIVAQQRARLHALVDKQHDAAPRDMASMPERAGAGEQVEHPRACDRIAIAMRQDIEQRLAQAVGGRADGVRLRRRRAGASANGHRRSRITFLASRAADRDPPLRLSRLRRRSRTSLWASFFVRSRRPRPAAAVAARASYPAALGPEHGRVAGPVAACPMRRPRRPSLLAFPGAASRRLLGFDRLATRRRVKIGFGLFGEPAPSCRAQLLRLHFLHRAVGKFGELERPVGDADQPVHLQAKMLQHIAHFAVLAFADREWSARHWRLARGRASPRSGRSGRRRW